MINLGSYNQDEQKRDEQQLHNKCFLDNWSNFGTVSGLPRQAEMDMTPLRVKLGAVLILKQEVHVTQQQMTHRLGPIVPPRCHMPPKKHLYLPKFIFHDVNWCQGFEHLYDHVGVSKHKSKNCPVWICCL